MTREFQEPGFSEVPGVPSNLQPSGTSPCALAQFSFFFLLKEKSPRARLSPKPVLLAQKCWWDLRHSQAGPHQTQ